MHYHFITFTASKQWQNMGFFKLLYSIAALLLANIVLCWLTIINWKISPVLSLLIFVGGILLLGTLGFLYVEDSSDL